jgi:hypothetical protein
MARKSSSFRLRPFMGLLSWALQLDLHAFRPLPGLARSNRNPRKVFMLTRSSKRQFVRRNNCLRVDTSTLSVELRSFVRRRDRHLTGDAHCDCQLTETMNHSFTRGINVPRLNSAIELFVVYSSRRSLRTCVPRTPNHHELFGCCRGLLLETSCGVRSGRRSLSSKK